MRRPSTSNFTSPSASTSSLSNWTTFTPFADTCTGLKCQSGLRERIIPPECSPR